MELQMSNANWRYGNIVLRTSLGFFLLMWGVDKLVATDDTLKIFSHFYKLPISASIASVVGIAEIVLGLFIMLGFMRKYVYPTGLILHLISTLSSWRQLIDPWGKFLIDGKNSHLFLASIPVLAAFFVLYFNRHDDFLTLDSRCCKSCKEG